MRGVQEALGGSTSAPLIVTVDTQKNVVCEDGEKTHDVTTYNHSWQEIYDALSAKRPAYMVSNIADEEFVSVTLDPIVEASHDLEADEYLVQGVATSYHFSDANSLVIESECSDK